MLLETTDGFKVRMAAPVDKSVPGCKTKMPVPVQKGKFGARESLDLNAVA